MDGWNVAAVHVLHERELSRVCKRSFACDSKELAGTLRHFLLIINSAMGQQNITKLGWCDGEISHGMRGWAGMYWCGVTRDGPITDTNSVSVQTTRRGGQLRFLKLGFRRHKMGLVKNIIKKWGARCFSIRGSFQASHLAAKGIQYLPRAR